ncbi:PKD domain-containing protein [Chitinophaga sp. MM2321]|uniref:PKD domain-containing protein n=1 Tax=Chitinophaga sp. MM2321 TaxID=3137178 RepID=UPI0032D5A784
MSLFILSKHKSLISSLLILLSACFISSAAGAQIKADFSASSTSDCELLLTTFSDKSTGTPVSWRWDFGNGYSSTEQHPSASYVKPGTYTVTLTVKNAAGETDVVTKTGYIIVRSKPVVDFTASSITGCAPFQTTFTDKSDPVDGTLTTYTWDYGDGTTGTGKSSQHTYKREGQYPVTLVVTNSFNCTSYKLVDKMVTVTPAPVANFTVAEKILCKAPVDVQFTNTSTGDGTLTYKWEFDDGTTSTLKDPGSHTFTTKGLHSIKLTVTNERQCTSVKTMSDINVAGYTTDITFPAPVCTNAPVVFSGVFPTGDQTNVAWEINGQPSPTNADNTTTYTPTTAGPIKVKLTATYGKCVEVVEKNIDVKPSPEANVTVAVPPVCNLPATATFNDNAPAATSWKWDFGDGQTATTQHPAHAYQAEGVFNATLVATNTAGCSVTSSTKVNIAPTKITAVGTGISGCEGLTATFSASSNNTDLIQTYAWDFGDGSAPSTSATPSHLYAKAGSYPVSLKYTTVNGCTGTVKTANNVEVYTKPTPEFYSPDIPTVCGNKAAAFINKSDLGDSWKWDFGDNTTGTGEKTGHSYKAPGTYTVQLTVGNHTCFNTITKENYITAVTPFPRFSVKPVDCDRRTTFTFEERSLGATSWEWNWGDGTDTSYTTQTGTLTHIFPASGTYVVKLTVSNGQCTAYESLKVTVIAASPVVISTDKTTLCSNEPLDASITTYDPAIYNPSAYKWMANGVDYNKNGSQESFVYRNLAPGKQLIQLSATNTQGCVDKSNIVTTNVRGPVAKFISPAAKCHGSELTFTDASDVSNSAGIRQWEWDFGDGTPVQTLTSEPFRHTYDESGSYKPVVKVTDKEGCTSTFNGKALLVNGPNAVFDASAYIVKPGTDVYFNNKSNVTGGTITSVNWDFGDGKSSTATGNVMNNYANKGLYKVKLQVTDNNGCKDVTENQVKVSAVGASFTYKASFVNGSNCAPVLFRFTNTSLDYKTSHWDFGDGGTSDEANPLHTYSTSGRYQVILTATGEANSVDTYIDTVEVKGPYAEIKASSGGGCMQKEIEFTVIPQGATDFSWDFTDGIIQQTTDLKVKHAFTSPGIYKPRLVLKDASGCKGSALLPDPIVIDKLDVSLEPVSATLCGAGTITFAPEFNSYSIDSLGKPATYKWTYDPSLVPTNETTATPGFYVDKPGKYDFSLTTTTAYGCEQTVTTSTMVYPKPVAAITGPDETCIAIPADFSGQVANGSNVTWKWNMGNGQIADVQKPASQSYSQAGPANVSLVITNKDGCTDTANHLLNVLPLPAAKASSLSEFICLHNTTVLQATGGSSYEWTPATGLSAPQTANPQANPETTTTYQVKVTDNKGCINTDQVTLRVVQPLKIQATPDTSLCLGDVLSLYASGADAYQWEGTGLTNPNANATTANLTSLGTYPYTVTGYDKEGCFSDKASLQVKVDPHPTVEIGPNREMMAGTPLYITAKASNDVVHYNWSPVEGLDCPTCPTVKAIPNLTTKYTLEVESNYGCKATDQMTVHILCNQGAVYMPNAFTPNEDGQNEYIYPKGKGVKEIAFLRIYDRWGSLVFENVHFQVNTPSAGWNGRSKNNKEAALGSYVYFMQTVCESGETYEFKGSVLLVR